MWPNSTWDWVFDCTMPLFIQACLSDMFIMMVLNRWYHKKFQYSYIVRRNKHYIRITTTFLLIVFAISLKWVVPTPSNDPKNVLKSIIKLFSMIPFSLYVLEHVVLWKASYHLPKYIGVHFFAFRPRSHLAH